MSRDLSSFYAQNVGKPEVVKVKVSDRFSEEFEFKAISNELDTEIRKRCLKKTIITQGKKKGQYEQNFDHLRYSVLLAIESTAFPNFKDVKLQESYGVMGEEDLFNAMFTPAEVRDICLAAEKANGYEQDLAEMVEDVKN